MEEDKETLLAKLNELQRLFRDAETTDQSVIERYLWVLRRSIHLYAEELGSVKCRKLLAEALRLPVQRPSSLYSSILWAAIKVFETFPDFHLMKFLQMWDVAHNLRPEDRERKVVDGKTFPSLEERAVKQGYISLLLWPDDKTDFHFTNTFGYKEVTPMVVTQLTQSEVKGRKMHFAALTSADGLEVMAEVHVLRRHPLVQCEKRHYVNVGQMYNVLLREKASGEGVRLVDAVLAEKPLSACFPVCVGYVDHTDEVHSHIHVYDSGSRHFVSAGQRFIKAERGQLVEFVPIVPLANKFKSAIILPATKGQDELLDEFPLREIRITRIDEERGFCAWELVDGSHPIVEQLSDLQLADGAVAGIATQGFINLADARRMLPHVASGMTADALIYLRRGKDGTKRPYVATLRNRA